MTKLTELVIEYQKTKSEQIFNQIYSLLKNTIKDKANYIFYQHIFRKGNYEFKLVETKQMELQDIVGELNLELLRMINNYVIDQPFENYLNNSLRLWIPKSINAEFLKNLKTQTIYKINGIGEEKNLADEIPVSKPICIEFIKPLAKIEQKIWALIQEDFKLSQEEIAKKLGVSQMTISRAIASIKEKIEK